MLESQGLLNKFICLKYLFICLCWILAVARGIYFLDQGSNPGTPALGGPLATGPPGKSLNKFKTYGNKHRVRQTSLVVQWLRFRSPNLGTQVQSLVREARSHMPQLRPDVAKINK